MKGIDIFCSSPASTAICSALDHRPVARRQHSNKIYAPCSYELLPNNPKPYNYEKTSKSSATAKTFHRRSSVDGREITSVRPSDLRRKSSADVSDLLVPATSSRYLLSDPNWVSESDHDQVSTILPKQHSKARNQTITSNNSPAQPHRSYSWASRSRDRNSELKHASSNGSETLKKYSFALESDQCLLSPVPTQITKPISRFTSSNGSPVFKSSSSARSHDQVVVLRVSIHCKGCEGKLRKHISKMDGVTSFSIDLETKKVVVKGDVTPLGVLASISKVKNAQLWPSPNSQSSPSPSPRWST